MTASETRCTYCSNALTKCPRCGRALYCRACDACEGCGVRPATIDPWYVVVELRRGDTLGRRLAYVPGERTAIVVADRFIAAEAAYTIDRDTRKTLMELTDSAAELDIQLRYFDLLLMGAGGDVVIMRSDDGSLPPPRAAEPMVTERAAGGQSSEPIDEDTAALRRRIARMRRELATAEAELSLRQGT